MECKDEKRDERVITKTVIGGSRAIGSDEPNLIVLWNPRTNLFATVKVDESIYLFTNRQNSSFS
jgi:hypothetical protein